MSRNLIEIPRKTRSKQKADKESWRSAIEGGACRGISGVEGGARGVEKPLLPPDQIRIIVRSTETLVPSYISDNAGLTSLISLSEVRDH